VAGFVSAIFTLLLFPMAYYAKLSNPDMPVLGWTSLTLAMFALCLRQGITVKRGAWFAAFLALAAATKDQSLGSFVFLVPVLLWKHLRSGRPDHIRQWKSIWAAPLATGASFLVVYVIASGIPVDPVRYQQHAAKVLFAGTTRGLYLRHPATPSGLFAQVSDVAGYLVDVMSWPLLLVAAVGALLALWKDRLPLALLLSSAGFFLMLLTVGMSRVHYSLPIALPLTAFAGYAISQAIKAGGGVRLGGLTAAAGITGLLLLQTIDLTHDMLRDSRYEAGDWLDHYTRPGDRVMHFGFAAKMPRLRAEVGQIRINLQSEALPSILADRPEFVVIVPQDINENRHRIEWRRGLNSAIAPLNPELFAQLVDESLGYRLVAKFQTPRLLPWLNRPFLSYPTVNPPVQIFARADRTAGLAKLEAWYDAPHYPRFVRVTELTVNAR
jgi:4-amino-4-deoxy-L-arabinose transferase-like glycosyltransferase